MSDKREGNEFPFVSCVFRWFWRDLVKCYVSVQVTYLLDILNQILCLFFLNYAIYIDVVKKFVCRIYFVNKF